MRNYALASGSASMKMAMIEDTAAIPETEESLEEVEFDEAAVTQNKTMMEYELPGTYDIDRANPLRVDLTDREVSCRYHVIAIPKADSCGYLAAEVKVDDIQDVLNTSADIYYDDTHLGNTFLNPDLSKETYDISLGKDEGIRLKRTQKKQYCSNVLLKGQTKVEYEYEIKIRSLKTKDSALTLKDQVPVSDDKTIAVEISQISGSKFNEETGEVVWDFELPANETKTITLSYSVARPKDKQLNL